jgi:hypothetical protein
LRNAGEKNPSEQEKLTETFALMQTVFVVEDYNYLGHDLSEFPVNLIFPKSYRLLP